MKEITGRMQVVSIGTKKCNYITCVYCAGGYCDMSEKECHYTEKDCIEE